MSSRHPFAVKAGTFTLVRRAAITVLLATTSLSFLGCLGGPAITEVSPARVSARGGESVTLRGSGFGEGTTVRLGDEHVRGSEIVSSSEIHFTTPPLFAGPATVVVTTEAGETVELANGLDVLPLDLRFHEAPPYALPADTDAAMVGAALRDFDGDGDPDIITCLKDAPCHLLRNDGRGNFVDVPKGKDGPRFPAGLSDPRVMAAADFDGDGAVDLFLGLGSMGIGVVYRNDGNATFSDAGPEVLPAGTDPVTAVAVGDLDGDGLPDLVIGNDTADDVPLRVYLNTSAGDAISFTEAEAGMIPERDWAVSAIAIVDVDGDGTLDLLVATPGAADGVALRLLVGGKKGFQEAADRLPKGTSGTVTAFAAGDVNGDGAVDIVAVGEGQDRLLVNDGTGHFFDATFSSMPLDATSGTSVALVDLDRDRDLDLVIGNAGAETRLYLNDGTGRFIDHTPILPIHADATVFLAAADVDDDADEDLVILNASPGQARLYLSVEPSIHDAH
ncbi:hypothetical protein A7982_12976 [Minicystis rosea]|nr:hypothetical protein A7982_12976 [Minicystis rosea]